MIISSGLVFVVFVTCIALLFDYTNGVHDAANSVATIVSTRVLTPRQAVLWAAFFNFVAFVIFGTSVATTIGRGMIDINVITPNVVLAGLIGAILWNITTWYLGLPSSSSHALIGGYAGAALAKAGGGVILFSGWIKTLAFILIAPIIGMSLGVVFIMVAYWVIYLLHKGPGTVDRYSRRIQLLSAALYSLGHGSNDAQKTMGIITSLLFSAGLLSTFSVPLWVVLTAHTAIGLGTLTGGWRIVKTMGTKIAKIRPIDGVCAETASAFSIFLATYLGIPVSTTHVITGAIAGVAGAKRLSSVRWGITINVVWAWILTIPMSALFAGVLYRLMIFSVH